MRFKGSCDVSSAGLLQPGGIFPIWLRGGSVVSSFLKQPEGFNQPKVSF